MATPERLQLNDELHLVLEQLIVVSVVNRTCVRSLAIKASCAVILSPIISLDRLVVHVELGMLAILAHAVRAICRTVSHFYFLRFFFKTSEIQIITISNY